MLGCKSLKHTCTSVDAVNLIVMRSLPMFRHILITGCVSL